MPQDDDPYNYDSKGAGFWRILCVCIVAICGLIVYAAFTFHGLDNPAAMEQANIARNLADGNGFRTHVIRPLDLTLQNVAIEDVDMPIRASWHAPFYARCLSWIFAVLNPDYTFSRNGMLDAETKAIIPFSIILILLTTVVIWFLVKDLFDDHLANLAALIFFISPVALHLAVDGGAFPLGMLLSVILLLCAWQCAKASLVASKWWLTLLYALLAGVTAGLLFLTSFASVIFIIGIAVFLFLELQKLRPVALSIYGVCFLLIATVWFMGNGSSVGWGGTSYFYGALPDTSLFPSDTVLRDMNPILRGWQVRAAVREGIANRYVALFQGNILGAGGIVILFFFVSLFHREERHWNQYLKWIVAGAFLLQPILPGVQGSPYDNWLLLMPFVVIFGVRAFRHILDQEEYFDASVKPILTGLLVLLCFLPSVTGLLRRGNASVYPPYHGPLQSYATEWVPDGAIIATDIPAATAWYGHALSMLVPTAASGISGLENVAAIYLADDMTIETYHPEWIRMRVDAVLPEDFDYTYAMYLPTGRRDQVLFVRLPAEDDTK